MRMDGNDVFFDTIEQGVTNVELTNNRLDISQVVSTDSSSYADGTPSWDTGVAKIPSLRYQNYSLISNSSLKIDTIGNDSYGNATLGKSQIVYNTRTTTFQETGYLFWTMRYSTIYPTYLAGDAGNYYWPNAWSGQYPMAFITIDGGELREAMSWCLGVPGGPGPGETTPGAYGDWIDDYVGDESTIPREREIIFLSNRYPWSGYENDRVFAGRKTGMILLGSEGNADFYETTCLISWKRNAGETPSQMSFFCWDVIGGYKGESNEFRTSEIECTAEDLNLNMSAIHLGLDRHVQSNGSASGGNIIHGVPDVSYDNIRLGQGKYYNPDNTDDVDAVKNMFNAMPTFDSMVGYKYSDESHNNNIIFTDTTEINLKPKKNMVKWTDVNYSSFPDLFFKQVKEPILKVMAAPSFLQFQYQNTFIIFTRNTINRFVLEGTADGWSGSAASLIEEKTQYGLLAEKSLTKAGDALFWLSEVGVVMWNKDGLSLISKNIVNVPIKDTCIGFYNSINNQYILHDNDSVDNSDSSSLGSTSYVYHIERNSWTKFKGLDVVNSRVLSGGSELDNVNLILDSSPSINKYPSDVLYVPPDVFLEVGYSGMFIMDYYTQAFVYITDDDFMFKVYDVIKVEDSAGSSEKMLITELGDYNAETRLQHILVERGHDDTNPVFHGMNSTVYNRFIDIPQIKTKDIFFEKGVLRRMKVDYEGGEPIVRSNMKALKADGTEVINTNSIDSPNSNQWRGVSLANSRGHTVSFGVEGADTIKNISYELRVDDKVEI